MIKQKTLIGTELDCVTKTLEKSQLSQIQRAFTNSNQSMEDILPAPTLDAMPSFLLGNLVNFTQVYKRLDININKVLVSRESVISHLPILVGETVTIRTYLRDIYEQHATSNPLGFIILESVGEKKGETAFYSERVLAIRGGFSRGRV